MRASGKLSPAPPDFEYEEGFFYPLIDEGLEVL